MTKFATIPAVLAMLTALASTAPAQAGGRWATYGNYYAGRALPFVSRINPGGPNLYYDGLRGYHQGGWELGRMYSQRHYGTDSGPYPGFWNRQSWSRPW